MDGVVRLSRVLSFPSNSLILLCGAPGCGKSTFARRHFAPTEIVSSDDCRRRVCDNVYNMKVHRETFSLVRHIARLRMSLGRLTVIDATALRRGMRRSMMRLAGDYGFRTGVIVLDVRLSTCLSRNKSRKRKVSEDVIRSFYILLHKAKTDVYKEGFDRIYVLGEEDVDQAIVTINRGS
ncbi:AAA family ATPase [Paludifilum halophilum]|nr:AAA family ATPase [Paludifilum halophilum]